LEVQIKKILFATLCAAALMSCASKRAAFVDSAVTEAKALQALAQNQGIELASAGSLIAAAEKKNEERQTEEAFVLADEAILQLQLSMLKKEQSDLDAKNSEAQASLNAANEALAISRNMLNESKNLPKEKIIK
jgi:hypothetical protein